MRHVSLFAFAVLASLWATPTRADAPLIVSGTHEERFSARVTFADLSLASQAGQRVLRDRVRAAAFQVCRDYGNSINDRADMTPYCARATYSDANPQIEAAIAGQGGAGLALSALRVRLASR